MPGARFLFLVLALAAIAGGGALGADSAPPAGSDFRRVAEAEEQARRYLTGSIVRWDRDRLRELAREIPSMSPALAGRAVWMTTTAPPRLDKTQVFVAAMSHSSPDVRIQALAALLGQGTSDSRRLVFGGLAGERDPAAFRDMVAILANRPSLEAVNNLIEIMLMPGPRPEVTAEAAQYLRRLTRANLSDNPSQWRDWWLDNSHLYN